MNLAFEYSLLGCYTVIHTRKRLADGLSGRTVNYEVGSLRGILRQFGLWGAIADRVHSLPERHNVGRALSPEDQSKLITAAGESRSPEAYVCDAPRRAPGRSEQTIRSLAGHVSNQMLQHYSHIRSQAKQAAIRTLEDQANDPVLPEHEQRIGQSGRNTQHEAEAKLLETTGGPARI